MQKYSYLLYWICDDKDSKYVKTNSVNHLYLIFRIVNECFEEINTNKYLILVLNNERKEKIKNMKNYGVKLDV